jgi:hypothetical protein
VSKLQSVFLGSSLRMIDHYHTLAKVRKFLNFSPTRNLCIRRSSLRACEASFRCSTFLPSCCRTWQSSFWTL